MSSDQRGLFLYYGRKILCDRLHDAEVQFPASGLEQPLIGGVLNQRVLELIGGFRSDAARIDELCVDQFLQGRLQLHLAHGSDRLKQLEGKLASDYRRDLGEFFCRSKTVQACRKRVSQSGRNLARHGTTVALQEQSRQLLSE